MKSLTSAFSSLGISDSSKKKNQKNGITTSLPNMSWSAEKTKVKTLCDEETEASEQPVDFSKKYCETKFMRSNQALKGGSQTFNKVVKSYNNSFTMYTETDLDQPTDYSLRCAEVDPDQCNKLQIAKNEVSTFDTIKTYCTEDTPYETPLNFSNATSMSDLRLDDKETKKNNAVINSKEKSEFSSGLMSPEKPVNYCEEGTPGYFSRVPSCGSLNSASEPQKKDSIKKEGKRVETKNVKFEDVVNYAEETPLMFSRSSSLASLDSIEQHSIHDDRSSVVSDFSRLTSGVISPSELPDSPSQTVPPSPNPGKTLNFPVLHQEKKSEALSQIADSPPKSSVFEDNVKNFKVESTPLHFSLTTSLSSLVDTAGNTETVNEGTNVEGVQKDSSESSEDEDILAACINIGMQSNRYSQPTDVTGDTLRTYCTEGTPALMSHAGSNSDLSTLSEKPSKADSKSQVKEIDENKTSSNEVFHESEPVNDCLLPLKTDLQLSEPSEDDDDDILENYIKNGIQNNRYTQKGHNEVVNDTVKSYCTEDTPAVLSNAGSCSNLSILSIQGNESGVVDEDFYDLESSSDEDELLDECIKLGMAAIAEKMKPGDNAQGSGQSDRLKEEAKEPTLEDDSSSISSLSDDFDSVLIEQCIQAGMPKSRNPPSEDTSHLFPAEKTQQCISSGTQKCSKQKKTNESADSKLTPKTRRRDSTALSASERLLLQQCILAGMPKSTTKTKTSTEECYFSDEDDILERCIQRGIQNNRYTPTRQNGRKVRNCVNEMKPTMFNNVSWSNLSLLSVQSNGNGALDDIVDSGTSSDEDELLEKCIKVGIAAFTEKKNVVDRLRKNGQTIRFKKKRKEPFVDTSSISSLSDESESALIEQCIEAGMPKAVKSSVEESVDLTLLQQCILTGLQKCQKLKRSDELKQNEQLLQHSGMRRNKNSARGGSSRSSTELSESERLLLQQCILAGMPKRNRKVKKTKEVEHTCCVHCPKNNRKKQCGKGKRKVKERIQLKEVYVRSQVVTVQKEVVDRVREKWV